jgi:hypothetical protein
MFSLAPVDKNVGSHALECKPKPLTLNPKPVDKNVGGHALGRRLCGAVFNEFLVHDPRGFA